MPKNKKMDERLQECLHWLRECSDFRQSYEPMWKDMYNAWQGKINMDDWPLDSAITFPYATQVMEQSAMRMIGGFPRLNINGRNPAYDGLAVAVRAFLQYLWSVNNMRYRQAHLYKAGEIYGTAFAMVPFRVKKETVGKWIPSVAENLFTGEVTPVTDESGQVINDNFVETEITTFSAASCEPIHIGDVWIPPGYTGLSDDDTVDGKTVPYLIHRDWSTLDKLKADKKAGIPWKNLDELSDAGDYTDYKTFSEKEIFDIMGINADGNYEKEGSNRINLMYFWDDSKIDGYASRLTVVANMRTIIYDGPNPLGYKIPFVCYRSVIVPHQFYGLPETYFSRGLADLINITANLNLQAINLSVNPPTIFDSTAIDARDMVMNPGQMIAANPGQRKSVRDLMFPATLDQGSMAAWNMHDRAAALYEEQTGVSKSAKGQLTNTDTATEVGIASRNESIKWSNKAMIAESTFITPLIKHWIMLSRKFVPQDEVYRVLGDLGQQFQNIPVGPNILNLEWIIDIEANSSMPHNNDAGRKMMVTELSQMLLQPPFDQFIDPYKLANKMIVDGYGENYPERYLKSQQQLQEEEKQQQMQAALAATIANQGPLDPQTSQEGMQNAISAGREQFAVSGQ